MSKKLMGCLHAIAKQKNYSHEELHQIVEKCGKTSLKQCTENELKSFIKWLKSKPPQKKTATMGCS